MGIKLGAELQVGDVVAYKSPRRDDLVGEWTVTEINPSRAYVLFDDGEVDYGRLDELSGSGFIRLGDSVRITDGEFNLFRDGRQGKTGVFVGVRILLDQGDQFFSGYEGEVMLVKRLEPVAPELEVIE